LQQPLQSLHLKFYRKQWTKEVKVSINSNDEVWNNVYKSDSTFFGEETSNFALLCFNNNMKTNDATKKVLELGAAHARDTTFFA
jgi:hypothetical protein